jgi:hypothetical protein
LSCADADTTGMEGGGRWTSDAGTTAGDPILLDGP